MDDRLAPLAEKGSCGALVPFSSSKGRGADIGKARVRIAMRPNERARCRFWASCDVRLSAIVGENVVLPSLFDMRS